jgi:hypothetical protein
MDEQRRSTRVTVDSETARILSTADVQVLDISVAGVLLHINRPVELGSRACLRLNLWGTPFSADVEFRRVQRLVGARDAGYGVGAVFVAITPEHRQLIERFASQ